MAVLGTLCSMELGNEVILGKKWNQDVVFSCRSFKSMGKEVLYPVSARKSIGRRFAGRRKYEFSVVANCSQSNFDSEVPAAAITVSKEGGDAIREKDFRTLEMSEVHSDNYDGILIDGILIDGDGGNGTYNNGRGGGGGSGSGDGDDHNGDKEEEEFGPIMKFEEVLKEVESRGVTLPLDMLEAAKSEGIRKLLLFRYLEMQGIGWPLGFLMKSCAMIRNRMLADPSFLFKVGVELVVDSLCSTVAEVQKRGKDFWPEFELYLADLLVGVGVNYALVALLAPYVRFGKPSVSKGFLGHIQHACEALPSSVFEAGRPGCRFSVQQRIATFFYKGLVYGAVGFGCGIVGQGIANSIMTLKRNIKKSEDEVPVPPLIKSAALWGVFLAVSSNTRYQIINGLERAVESSPLGKNIPTVASAFTVGIRCGNTVYAGIQFIDWARWSGVQGARVFVKEEKYCVIVLAKTLVGETYPSRKASGMVRVNREPTTEISSFGFEAQPPDYSKVCACRLLQAGWSSVLKMLEGKAVVRETDMPEGIQGHVLELAYKALDQHEVSDCQSIACFIKQRFDEVYGPSWHCVVGKAFGGCITHLCGSFISFHVDTMEFLIFKDGRDSSKSVEESVGVRHKS